MLTNLAYLIGAVVLASSSGLLVWLHHRKPKSFDANVESFNRGLRALAPEARPAEPRHSARARIATPPRSETAVPMRSVRLDPLAEPSPGGPIPAEPAGEGRRRPTAAPPTPGRHDRRGRRGPR